MLFVKLPCLFFACLMLSYEIHASSHWMVTESGLIQPRLDSPFEMARPYDLLAFLNQEKRWDSIFDLFEDLMRRQVEIDKLWENVGKYTDVGRQIAQDDDCLRAGNVNVIDWYAALLEDGSNKIHPNEFLLQTPHYGPNNDTPDCKRISSLAFSMFAFEHLSSMKQRGNLTANPEFVLPELISPIMTIDQFGHWLSGVLRRNSSSWLHYHMASLYWRVRGNVPKAIECSRRALHYAPRVFKDVALGSLGMVLHRSGKTKDAIIVLNAAVEHDPKNYVSHFSIANAYSVIGEFNASIKYYDLTLKLNPRMDLALKHKYGVLCHAKLAVRIKEIRETLNKLRDELNDYYLKEAAWPKMQGDFLRTLKNGEEFDYRNTDKNCEKMSAITGLDIKQLKAHIEKNSLIKYFIDGPMYNDKKLGKQGIDTIEAIYSLERLIIHINKNGQVPTDSSFQAEKPFEDLNNVNVNIKPPVPVPDKPNPEIKTPLFSSNEKKTNNNINTPLENMSEYETGIFMYPTSMTINRNAQDFDKEIEWPTEDFCKLVPKVENNLDAVVPVFLPFENKGIRMRSLLSDKLGVPISEEYELPWHPPACAHDKDAHRKPKHGSPEIVETDYLRTKLLEYVSDGNVEAAQQMQEAEIGQRIYAAMKKKLAPKWILLTLSSLYWRVRKNNINALHCLNAAVKWVREEYRDLVLVSLSSVYFEMGYLEDAAAAAESAFRLSLYEPSTNFLLSQIHIMKKNYNTHMFHLKQTVRVESNYMDGLARQLLNNWACLIKHLISIKDMDFGEGDICTQVKPMVNVVCERDGENCQMSNIQCFSGHERTDSSKLVVLLQQKERQFSPDSIDTTFFDHFIENSPRDRADRLAHHANYDNMVKTIESTLNGCGHGGCKNLKAEDMSMTEEDCAHHHLQVGYWLHIVSFRQLLAESDVEQPSEITFMTPSNKKVPDCRIIGDPMEDFVLEKLVRVTTDDWEPVLSLMHQFAEMFDSFDYVTLGMKIAKYVETRPGSWWGALVAGWWCGAGGRGACALRCLAAAHARAPNTHRRHALRALAALLHMQSKQLEAKEVAYLSFYLAPKSKIEAFLVAVSHTYLAEYEQAVWMYRYALAFDEKFVPSKACLHATMCLLFYGENKGKAKDVK